MSLFPSSTDLFATRLREVAHQDHPAALTVTQLAQLLNVSRGSIYKLIEYNACAFPFPGEAGRGSSGRRPSGRLARFFFRSLSLDIAFHRLQGSITDTPDVVRTVPKVRFPIKLS